MPFSYAEAVRGIRGNRSRDRSRMDEEEHREAMWRALAEADAAQQLRPDGLRPDVLRADTHRVDSGRSVELPLLHPDIMEPVPRPPRTSITPAEPVDPRFVIRQTPSRDENGDVNMTQ